MFEFHEKPETVVFNFKFMVTTSSKWQMTERKLGPFVSFLTRCPVNTLNDDILSHQIDVQYPMKQVFSTVTVIVWTGENRHCLGLK